MKALQTLIDWESLEISQENVYDGVYFSKVTELQCIDYNSAIKTLLYRFFLEYIPKTSYLKKMF